MPTKKTAAKKTSTKKAAAKTAPTKTARTKTAPTKTAPTKTAPTKTPPTKTPPTTTTTTTTKAPAKKAAPPTDPAVAAYIEQRFADLGDWRGAMLTRMRGLIFAADPEMFEQRQWIKPTNPHGVPTYSHGGLILTLEVYKAYVKLTFAQGSKVPDPTGIFNASLLGLRRAIDIKEGDTVDATAFKALVTAAVELNAAKVKV